MAAFLDVVHAEANNGQAAGQRFPGLGRAQVDDGVNVGKGHCSKCTVGDLACPGPRHNPSGSLGYAGGMKEVSPAEGQALVQGGAVLVDVREPNEYSEIHAEGAQLLPLSELEARYAELPKDRPLVMICRSGARSARAGEFLLQNGYADVTNLAGGTLAWNEAGLPVVGGDA